MPFQVKTNELNEVLGTSSGGDTKIYGEEFNLFKYIYCEDLDDFIHEGEIGEALKYGDRVYFKARNEDEDAVLILWDEDNTLTAL